VTIARPACDGLQQKQFNTPNRDAGVIPTLARWPRETSFRRDAVRAGVFGERVVADLLDRREVAMRDEFRPLELRDVVRDRAQRQVDDLALVSRFRSSHHCEARSFANFESKDTSTY